MIFFKSDLRNFCAWFRGGGLYSVNQKRQNNEISSILLEIEQRYFSAS